MKNKFNINRFWTILALVFMSLLASSCGRDTNSPITPSKQPEQPKQPETPKQPEQPGQPEQPVQPGQPNQGTTEFNWKKVEIVLLEGHGHGGGEAHGNHFRLGSTILPKEQKMIIENTPSGMVVTRFSRFVREKENPKAGEAKTEFYEHPLASDAPFEVRSSETLSLGFGMRISYYNDKGVMINNEILEPGKHQHLFYTQEYSSWTTKSVVERKDNGFIEDLYNLHYRGEKDGHKKLGVKANFFFKKRLAKFNMTVQLINTNGNNDISGTNPPLDVVNAKSLAKYNIPFVVIEDTEQYRTNKNEYLNNIIKYYDLKMTADDLEDWFVTMDSVTPPEGLFLQ
ncbi:MAG: hypothetical protein Q4A00_00225 [Flavobacteriaceae bacterium]|nr:hypothetical protein [Flavobacteriaceae bacterium]